jgi:hypothetical protein
MQLIDDPAPYRKHFKGRPIPDLTTADADRFWVKVDKRGADDCWAWTAGKLSRYGSFAIARQPFIASRVAFFLANGPFDWDQCVCHECDNPLCCNPRHLFLDTVEGNIADRVRKGRTGKYLLGKKNDVHPSHKFNFEVAREIRRLASEFTQRELSKRFGVGKTRVNDILLNRVWKCEDDPLWVGPPVVFQTRFLTADLKAAVLASSEPRPVLAERLGLSIQQVSNIRNYARRSQALQLKARNNAPTPK